MFSHSESFDENSGKNLIDLVGLQRKRWFRLQLPSVSTRHEGAKTKGEEEEEEEETG